MTGFSWQELLVAGAILAAAGYVYRRFRPRKRKTTVAFVPLKDLRPRPPRKP